MCGICGVAFTARHRSVESKLIDRMCTNIALQFEPDVLHLVSAKTLLLLDRGLFIFLWCIKRARLLTPLNISLPHLIEI